MIKHYALAFTLIASVACSNRSQTTEQSKQARENGETIEESSPEAGEEQAYIVIFGNSLTAGYGLETQESFPSLLQQRIDSLGLPYTVVNAGLSGETSSGGLNRIDWVLQQPMDLFVLELGANDALRGLDPVATRANLQGIIDKVSAQHADIPMKAPPNMGEAYTEAFDAIYPDLARSNQADLIPFLLDGVAGEPALNLPDGKHPNAEGQHIVADNVWRVLFPNLKTPL